MDEGNVAEAGEGAAQGMAPSADVAAVEGMLSGLALSDTGAESAVAAAPALCAAAQPDQAPAEAEAPTAFGDAAAPDLKLEDAEAPVPGAAPKAAEAAKAGPDLAAAAPTCDTSEKLVREAEQQLAQLRLCAGHSGETADAPLTAQQQAAEGPHLEGNAAAVSAGRVEGAEHTAGQEDSGQSKPARSKRGSLTKKVFSLPLQQLWVLRKASGQDRICMCSIQSVMTCTALDSTDADLSCLWCCCATGQQ